jgi:hypothetical protein
VGLINISWRGFITPGGRGWNNETLKRLTFLMGSEKKWREEEEGGMESCEQAKIKSVGRKFPFPNKKKK